MNIKKIFSRYTAIIGDLTFHKIKMKTKLSLSLMNYKKFTKL